MSRLPSGRLLAAAVGLGLLLAPRPAGANFHWMKIREVFPGTAAQPAAQYVMLQMFFPGQTSVGGHAVHVFDAANTPVTMFTFAGPVGNGASQATLLVATAEAASLFDVTANLTMTAVLPLAGGKVCFDTIDCVSWGSFPAGPSGGSPTSSGNTGTPWGQGVGLRLGQAIRRDVSPGNPTVLEDNDDTNDSAADFGCASPNPTNNAGVSGTLPADPACSPTSTTNPTGTTVPSTSTPSTTSTTSTTFPPEVGQKVSGQKLLLKRKTFNVTSRDPTISLGDGNGSTDDPTIHGGSLRLFSATGGLDATIQLPSTRWRLIGKAGQNKGYKLAPNQVLRVVIKAGKLLKVNGMGAVENPLEVGPDPVAVAVAIGAERYCLAFPGGVFTPRKKYLAKNAPAPAACPP